MAWEGRKQLELSRKAASAVVEWVQAGGAGTAAAAPVAARPQRRETQGAQHRHRGKVAQACMWCRPPLRSWSATSANVLNSALVLLSR
jgi:hypothetical protein